MEMAANNEAIVRYTRHSVYMDTMITRRCGKLHLAKLLCAWRGQEILTTETLWLLKRTGILLDICHEVLQSCALFLKRGGNIHYTVTITAVHFFGGLIV